MASFFSFPSLPLFLFILVFPPTLLHNPIVSPPTSPKNCAPFLPLFLLAYCPLFPEHPTLMAGNGDGVIQVSSSLTCLFNFLVLSVIPAILWSEGRGIWQSQNLAASLYGKTRSCVLCVCNPERFCLVQMCVKACVRMHVHTVKLESVHWGKSLTTQDHITGLAIVKHALKRWGHWLSAEHHNLCLKPSTTSTARVRKLWSENINKTNSKTDMRNKIRGRFFF